MSNIHVHIHAYICSVEGSVCKFKIKCPQNVHVLYIWFDCKCYTLINYLTLDSLILILISSYPELIVDKYVLSCYSFLYYVAM